MRPLRTLVSRLLGSLGWRHADRELFQDVEAHLELLTDEYVRRGLSRQDARAAARREFGNVSSMEDLYREQRGLTWIDDLRRDLRHAFASLLRQRGFTVVVILTLGLGIGASTALFSVVNAVVLRPLRVPDADRLVRSMTLNNGAPMGATDPYTFKVWRESDSTFENVSAHRLDFVNMTGRREPEQLAVARVSEPFLRLFHAPVLVGRAFSVAEDRPGAPGVAILSHGLWTRAFGADRAVIGQTISLGSLPHVIVGVLGPDFDSEQFDPAPDVWVPLRADADRIDGASIYDVSARLRPGVTVEAANASLRVAHAAYTSRQPGANRQAERGGWIAQPLREAMVGSIRSSLDLLVGAVAFLLLIACANVANLLLMRADGRTREMAVRAALGASRRRLVWQGLVESLVLSCAGSLVGLVIGPVAIRWLLKLYPGTNPFVLGAPSAVIPRIGDGASAVTVDWHVLAFTLGLALFTGLAFGILPAWHLTRGNIQAALHETRDPGAAGRRGFGRTALVIAEMSLAVILVVAAALLIRSSLAVRRVDPGLRPDHVLTMRMSVSGTHAETQQGISDLTRAGIARVEAIPGVIRASTTCCMPLETVWQLPFVMESRAGQGLTTAGNMRFHGFGGWTFVSPGYFDVFGVPIRRGRDFTVHDDAHAPGVVIINEAMAQKYWPDGDPLRDRLQIGRGMRDAYDRDPIRQIIGIVGNVRDTGLTRAARPAMYVPVAQIPDAVTVANVQLLPLVWIVRTTSDPHRLSDPVERALESASGGLPVARVRAMSEVVSESTARARFDTWLMTIFGLCAITLAAIGIYGLIAYWVQRRAREIGVRLALGARASTVASMVVRQGMRLTAAGVVMGLAGAFTLARLLAGLLFGVQPRDPLVFAIVPVVLAFAALLAIWIPARRASRINPLEALRRE